MEAHQRSFDRGVQIGHQRRNKVGPVPLLPLRVTSVLISGKIMILQYPAICLTFRIQAMLCFQTAVLKRQIDCVNVC